jgi:uncharacterized membrane protein
VLAAAVVAIRRGEPHVMHFIAQDMAVTAAGQRITRKEYEAELRAASERLDPQKQATQALLKRSIGYEP